MGGRCTPSWTKVRMLDVRFADTGGDELFTISPRRLLPLVMLVLGLGGGFMGMAGTFGDSCPVAGQYMAGGGACARDERESHDTRVLAVECET